MAFKMQYSEIYGFIEWHSLRRLDIEIGKQTTRQHLNYNVNCGRNKIYLVTKLY